MDEAGRDERGGFGGDEREEIDKDDRMDIGDNKGRGSVCTDRFKISKGKAETNHGGCKGRQWERGDESDDGRGRRGGEERKGEWEEIEIEKERRR